MQTAKPALCIVVEDSLMGVMRQRDKGSKGACIYNVSLYAAPSCEGKTRLLNLSTVRVQ